MKSARIILTWLTTLIGGLCLMETLGPVATFGIALVVLGSELRMSWIE